MAGFVAPFSRQLSQSVKRMIAFCSWTPNLRSSLSLNDPLGPSFRRAGAAQRGGWFRYTQQGRTEEDPWKGCGVDPATFQWCCNFLESAPVGKSSLLSIYGGSFEQRGGNAGLRSDCFPGACTLHRQMPVFP